MKKNARNANYDLMKILSMFFIVLYHVIVHGNVLANIHNYTLYLITEIVLLICLVHVNSFVLVTGYFQCTNQFKASKVWQLINSTMFYKIMIVLVAVLLFHNTLGPVPLLNQLSPILTDEYWFVKMYIILYCLSPFLNIMIKNINQRQHKQLLWCLFVFFSIIPYITGGQGFPNDGYTLYQFLFLYLLGAYFRKYPFLQSNIGKCFTKSKVQLILFFICIGCVIANYCFNTTLDVYMNTNRITNHLFQNMLGMKMAYSNPFVIVQSLAYFLLFATFSFKSSWISKISACTLGVYLLHDHTLMRYSLYVKLGVGTAPIYSLSFFFYMLAVSVLIFVVGIIIEYFRQCLFKFVYNRKISIKIRKRYYRWVHSLSEETSS